MSCQWILGKVLLVVALISVLSLQFDKLGEIKSYGTELETRDKYTYNSGKLNPMVFTTRFEASSLISRIQYIQEKSTNPLGE